jgi:hypothetical protein
MTTSTQTPPKAETGKSLNEKIQEAFRNLNSSAVKQHLAIARLLRRMADQKLYKELQYKTIEEYLKEIDYSPVMKAYLLKLSEVDSDDLDDIEGRGISGSQLFELSKAVTLGENIPKIIEDFEDDFGGSLATLTVRDLASKLSKFNKENPGAYKRESNAGRNRLTVKQKLKAFGDRAIKDGASQQDYLEALRVEVKSVEAKVAEATKMSNGTPATVKTTET